MVRRINGDVTIRRREDDNGVEGVDGVDGVGIAFVQSTMEEFEMTMLQEPVSAPMDRIASQSSAVERCDAGCMRRGRCDPREPDKGGRAYCLFVRKLRHAELHPARARRR